MAPRIDNGSKGPERLSEILSRLFAARGWGRQQERLRLERAWAEAAGPEYAAITRVAGFRRNVLEVEVKGSIPLQELSQFHKRRVLERLRQVLAGVTIADLRFRAGAL
jgi:predicted nucleic acid-binding Zn ribbon protein